MTKPKKSHPTVIGREIAELERLSEIPGSGVTKTVYDASQPVDVARLVAEHAPRCHACHNPVSAEVCAACGNKQP